MRVFIDSRDLINAFNASQPVPIGDLASRFTAGQHTLILPFSLISELIPADNNVIVVLRRFTKIEEDFPYEFFKQHHLPDLEIRNAAQQYLAGTSPTPYDPFVRSFHELWGTEFEKDPIFLMDVDRTIGLRKLSRQIELCLQKPQVFHWQKQEAARAVAILESEQRAIVKDKPKAVFQNTAIRWLGRAGVSMAPAQLIGFVNMLRQNPTIAPGWRLYIEVFKQLTRNTSYRPTVNDVWDLANITLVPYVGACTLDNQKVQLVKQACQRLRAFDPTIDYEQRTVSDIKQLLALL